MHYSLIFFYCYLISLNYEKCITKLFIIIQAIIKVINIELDSLKGKNIYFDFTFAINCDFTIINAEQ